MLHFFPCLVYDPLLVPEELLAALSSVSQPYYFQSFQRLLASLLSLSSAEYNLTYPLLVVLNCDGVKLPEASLSPSQLSHLFSLLFPHLNMIVLQQADLQTVQKVYSEMMLSHHFFLKNKYRRAQAWIGLSSYNNDLLCTFQRYCSSAHELQKWQSALLASVQQNTFQESSYPILPSHISTMNKSLAHLLSGTAQPPSPTSLSAYVSYSSTILHNIDFSALLNLSTDRKFYIKNFLIECWNFPAHSLTYDELVYVCYLIFKRAFSLFSSSLPLIPADNKLLLILFKVRELYNGGNDFHNFRHAVDVVQAIFCYLLKLNLLPKDSLISQKTIVHRYRRSKSKHTLNPVPNTVDSLINKNEQTIDNNDDLSKEPEELDPLTEYLVYLKSPNLYLNQLKTYQAIIDSQYPLSTVNPDDPQNIITTDYGKFLQKDKSFLLDPVEVLALLIAALGHDSGHPGLTNLFINTNKSPLSTIFCDESVLEKYHFIIFNDLLQKLWPALFDDSIIKNATSTPNKVVNVKKIIQNSILATDMEKHFLFIDQIKNKERDAVESFQNLSSSSSLPEFDLYPELLCQLLLKCADISNITRPLKLSANWGLILGKEMQEITTLSKIFTYNNVLQEKINNNSDYNITNNQDFINHFKLYNSEDTELLKQVNQFFANATASTPSPNDPQQSTLQNIYQEIEQQSTNYTLRRLLEKNPSLCLSQIFFIEKISYKLFEKISQVLPWLNYTLIILDKNLQFWKLFKEKHNIKP